MKYILLAGEGQDALIDENKRGLFRESGQGGLAEKLTFQLKKMRINQLFQEPQEEHSEAREP